MAITKCPMTLNSLRQKVLLLANFSTQTTPTANSGMISYQWGIEAIVLFLLLQTSVRTNGHILGEHLLTGEEPTGDPNLPEITGPYEVELKVRYNALNATKYQTLLEYTDMSSNANTLFFGHITGTGNLMVHQYVGGVLTSCSTGPISSLIPTLGTVHTVKFKVDSAGTGSIFVDGIHILNCSGVMLIPTNTARIHTVGTGTYITEHPNDVMALQGAIVGLRVTNLPSTSVMDRFKFMSLPGQPRGHRFVVSFYARFDDLTLSNQRVFDFSNGQYLVDHISCGQRNSNDMECHVRQSFAIPPHRVIAANSIVQGVFAFWHFGVDADRTMWISKDGVMLATQSEPTLEMADIFRNDLLFGTSGPSYTQRDDLHGAVLGFRLDRGESMSTNR